MNRSVNLPLWRIYILAIVLLVTVVGITYSASAHDNSPSTPMGYKLPFEPNRLAKITNGPNEGNHGVDCCAISREAIDFVYVSSDQWSSVRAAKGGTVIFAQFQAGGYGNLIIIQHTDGFFSYYEHLATITSGILNTVVNKGTQIGTIGNTGTNYIHLHFEVRDGVETDPLDVGSGDSRGHSILGSNKYYKRIGLFPWYPNVDLNTGFIPRSMSHPMGVCLDNHNLSLRWLAPSEFDHIENSDNNADRFQGYDWVLDNTKTTIPGGVLDNGSATANGITYSNLADGNWWFHMRAYSTEYAWAPASSVSHIGPFKIQTVCNPSATPEDWLADPD